MRYTLSPLFVVLVINGASGAETTDDVLRYYVSKTGIVMAIELTSDPERVVVDRDVVHYQCSYILTAMMKGKGSFDEKPITIIRVEPKGESRPSYLLKGGKCIVFVRRLDESDPTKGVISVDPWFGVQPYSDALAESLHRISREQQAAPISDLDDYLLASVKQRQFSGSVLVARGGKVLLSRGYGLADRENDVACTPRTKFRIGSLTKQFTAMAIMILHERGKLDVSDKIEKHLPDSPASWAGIAIHHLLSHSSGIPNITEVDPRYMHLVAKSTTPDELVATFRDKPLLFEPGEKGRYSNSNYILLGMIIEKVSGRHYDEFLRDNIFDRLKMNDTGFDRALPILKHRAQGYAVWRFNVVNAAPIDMSVPFAAGGLYSTTEDLYRWSESEVLDSYTGDYELTGSIFDLYVPAHYLDWPLGKGTPKLVITISRDGQRLFGQIDGQQPIELVPESATRFHCRDTPVRVTFASDKEGKVTNLQLGTDGFRAEKIR